MLNDDQKTMIAAICRTNPLERPLLDYRNDFELLIAVILSAQCTDAMVNKVTPALFAAYPSPATMAVAPVAELERLIHSTGFYRAKAKNLQATAELLVGRHGGQVPEAMADLTALPGVGRKTANVIRGALFHQPAIIVDTHFKRVVRRLGLTEAQDPTAIELELLDLIPAAEQYQFSMSANLHGRRTCTARSPHCEDCPIHRLCPASSI